MREIEIEKNGLKNCKMIDSKMEKSERQGKIKKRKIILKTVMKCWIFFEFPYKMTIFGKKHSLTTSFY